MWETLGRFSDLFGVAGTVFSLLAWVWARRAARDADAERRRQNEEVRVVLSLVGGSKRHSLPFFLRRGSITRAEILGLLGMLPMSKPGARFALNFLATPEFFGTLKRVQEGSESELTIPCSDEELDQFRLG